MQKKSKAIPKNNRESAGDTTKIERKKILGKSEIHPKINERKLSREKSEEPYFPYLRFKESKEGNYVKKIECRAFSVPVDLLDSFKTAIKTYKTITVLELRNCKINADGILRIVHLLKIGSLRDLNLDMNPNPEENYDLLCQSSYNLLYLSLKFCKISDSGIRKIADKLKYKDPFNIPKLIVLNVSFNFITKVGCRHLSKMLRMNRSLRSLVLSGNRICDDGAIMIIQELSMHSLSHLEIIDLRRHRFLTLQKKSYHESSDDSVTSENSDKVIHTRHPLDKEVIQTKGAIYTNGNVHLQHLSLNFNRLTNLTLKKLIDCLHYQNHILLQDRSRGLLHVFLEGNHFQSKNINDYWIEFRDLMRVRCQSSDLSQKINNFDNSIPIESRSFEILTNKN